MERCIVVLRNYIVSPDGESTYILKNVDRNEKYGIIYAYTIGEVEMQCSYGMRNKNHIGISEISPKL